MKGHFPDFAGLDDAALKVCPAMAKQVENLRKGLDSLVMNIKNNDALDAALDKLAVRHKERAMPADYFQVRERRSDTCLIKYVCKM